MKNKKSQKIGWKLSLVSMFLLGTITYFGATMGMAQSFEEILSINVGDYGGKWESLESGETIFVFSDGTNPCSLWVKDGNKLYYIDASGCLMKENYSHDGFYVGKDGALDKSVKRLEKDQKPFEGKEYRCTDGSGKTWVFSLLFSKANMYYSEDTSYGADYNIVSLGRGIFLLYNISDEFDKCHAVVLDGGKTLRVSSAGETEKFTIQ